MLGTGKAELARVIQLVSPIWAKITTVIQVHFTDFAMS
jgi:hypothetical protein